MTRAMSAGWAIVPDWWGKGAATEIVGAVLDWADTVLDAPEVRCIINPGNGASERVAAKLGFDRIACEMLADHPVNVYARVRKG